MAEPTASENASTDEARPKLVAVDPTEETTAQPGAEPPQPRGETGPAAAGSVRRGSRIVTWLLAALLVAALVWAGLQSQQLQVAADRNQALAEHVQGLEVQLSAASLQLQSYEMRQDLVRSVAADLAMQVGRLQELVDPGPPPAVDTGAP